LPKSRKQASEQKAKMTRLEKLAALNLGFVGLIYSLNKWVAEDTSITTLIAYLPTFIWVIPTIVLLIACLFARKRKIALLYVSAAVLWGLMLTGFSVPSPLTEIEGHEFSLLTFNIHHGSKGWDGMREVIQEKDPYVLCFQEADDLRHTGSAVGELPGYFVERWGGLAIACKEPFVSVRPVQLFSGTRDAIEAETRVGAKVVNVHLKSFNVGEHAKNPLRLAGHVKKIADIHDAQISALVAKYAGKRDYVIAGDFNNPPCGNNFRTLNREFNDVFGKKGWGFGYTYPSNFPVLRIDYAFTTDIKPLSAEVVPTTQSDHRPVFLNLLVYRPT
jgi:vancomycin resistance protein VanJ